LVRLWRRTMQYRPRRGDDAALRARLKELAESRRRFGAWRLYLLLRREGVVVNHKRVHRLYVEEGLSLRRRRGRKRAAVVRVPLPGARRQNEKWSMDFVSDALANGRRFRVLTVVDDFTRECLGLEVDTSLNGVRVAGVLDRVIEERGVPEAITVDNGPEFAGRVLDEWAHRKGIKLDFIRPGKPVENAYVESFNGRLRDECLNEHNFTMLADARETIEAWGLDYNEARPHTALDGLTPAEFRRQSGGLNQLPAA